MRYIPFEKRSKKEQRDLYSARRKNWGEISPVTRKAPNPKAYKRRKSGKRFENEPESGFLLYTIKLCIICT